MTIRPLSISQKTFAAESLSVAFSHLRTAEALISTKEYAAAVRDLYFAALFFAKASLAEQGNRSPNHEYWLSRFNEKFGRGRSWIPKTYVKLLNTLEPLRAHHDYRAAVGNSREQALRFLKTTARFANKVRANTPLIMYPEFIEDFAIRSSEHRALEFDFYCPKSYLHKERIQFQVKSSEANAKYLAQIGRTGKAATRKLRVNRAEDYVLGWNSRLGQAAEGFLLFLDLDESDEGAIKAALRGTSGWLFKSGDGFHFIGQEVYPSRKAWLARMKKAVRSKGLRRMIDLRHVKYSEKRGYATLRISSCSIKPFVPFLCWDNTK